MTGMPEKIGPYTITREIGRGGMGVVYLARDTKLDRDVAIKALPGEMADDDDRLARFEREAKLLASLNHPHIATIHGLEEADGKQYLILEYIEGDTLAQRLQRGAIPVTEALAIAKQIAEAIEAAHEKGVIHRDLKPANIKFTSEGQVKILDFGLAKSIQTQALADTEIADSPTIVSPAPGSPTMPGVVLGTAGYMSPEQARGRPADKRTDIFSFGCLLYEMLTGRMTFAGETTADMIAKILQRDPDFDALPDTTPPDIRHLLQRCLAKDPKHRLRDIGDARLELEEPNAGLPEVAVDLRRLRAPTARRGRIEALAVLPLANLSGDPAQEYFTDGMTDALINDLAKIGSLKVISRTSAMHFKGTSKPLHEIAQALNVGALVEGSVLRAGDRVRITVQLIEAATDQHLWAESYEADMHDILTLQRDVSRAIAQEIKVKLTPREQEHLASTHSVNQEAYEAYLKGRYYWNKRTDAGMKKGLKYFEQAIEKDPAYPLGYAGLADTYVALGFFCTLAPKEAYPKAKVAALKALGAYEVLAEAHASLALARYQYDWDWSIAEGEFKRAIELNPNYATAHQWYAEFLTAMGRHEEAIGQIERARECDPLSLIINTYVGWNFHMAGDYDQALEQYRKTLEMDPNFYVANLYVGLTYEQKAWFEEAIAAFQKAKALAEGNTWATALLGHAYAASGKRGEAKEVLKALKDLSKRRYVPAYDRAVVYAGLDEEGKTFEWLNKAYEERSGRLPLLKVAPIFDALRDDPRFQDLLRRMNFPE